MAVGKTNKHTTQYWLMKSEPDVYSIDTLKIDREGQWDGVRNYQVRNMMRDVMQPGDLALFYHSNTKEIGCAGLMEIVGEAYPDPLQFDQTSEYFDPKAKPENPPWLCVPVRFMEKFARVVTLAEIKANPKLAGMAIVAKGNRLSVTPVTKAHFIHICKLGRAEQRST